jgi:hypothetical protein
MMNRETMKGAMNMDNQTLIDALFNQEFQSAGRRGIRGVNFHLGNARRVPYWTDRRVMLPGQGRKTADLEDLVAPELAEALLGEKVRTARTLAKAHPMKRLFLIGGYCGENVFGPDADADVLMILAGEPSPVADNVAIMQSANGDWAIPDPYLLGMVMRILPNAQFYPSDWIGLEDATDRRVTLIYAKDGNRHGLICPKHGVKCGLDYYTSIYEALQ